jgi:hypothetical protein
VLVVVRRQPAGALDVVDAQRAGLGAAATSLIITDVAGVADAAESPAATVPANTRPQTATPAAVFVSPEKTSTRKRSSDGRICRPP